MASYKDYECLWNRYQNEGVKQGRTIVGYCEDHGIMYRHFEKWYKQYYKQRAYQVQIENTPEEYQGEGSSELISKPTADYVKPKGKPSLEDASVQVVKIDLTLSNGIVYHGEKTSYASLRLLLEKLEALCLD